MPILDVNPVTTSPRLRPEDGLQQVALAAEAVCQLVVLGGIHGNALLKAGRLAERINEMRKERDKLRLRALDCGDEDAETRASELDVEIGKASVEYARGEAENESKLIRNEMICIAVGLGGLLVGP